jgi:hypothetical protein
VIVHPSDGPFKAALVGAPDVSAIASTHEEALAADVIDRLAKVRDYDGVQLLEVPSE